MIKIILWRVDRPILPPKKRRKRPPNPHQELGVVELQALPRLGEFIILPTPDGYEAYRVIAVTHRVGHRLKPINGQLVWPALSQDLINDVFIVRAGTEEQLRERFHRRDEFP